MSSVMIIKRKADDGASDDTKKALVRLGNILSGRVAVPLDGSAADLVAVISNKVQFAVEQGQKSERDKIWDEYQALCDNQNHVCRACKEALPPGGDDGTRSVFSSEEACEHIGDFHFHCLFKTVGTIGRSSYDSLTNISSFSDGSHYKPIDMGHSAAAVGCNLVVVRCPLCRKHARVAISSLTNGTPVRFQACEPPPRLRLRPEDENAVVPDSTRPPSPSPSQESDDDDVAVFRDRGTGAS
jgi:hypothetical protein